MPKISVYSFKIICQNNKEHSEGKTLTNSLSFGVEINIQTQKQHWYILSYKTLNDKPKAENSLAILVVTTGDPATGHLSRRLTVLIALWRSLTVPRAGSFSREFRTKFGSVNCSDS